MKTSHRSYEQKGDNYLRWYGEKEPREEERQCDTIRWKSKEQYSSGVKESNNWSWWKDGARKMGREEATKEARETVFDIMKRSSGDE